LYLFANGIIPEFQSNLSSVFRATKSKCDVNVTGRQSVLIYNNR